LFPRADFRGVFLKAAKWHVVKTYPLASREKIRRMSGMYVRRCYRQKNGKRHAYWALVESYRTARGPRQRVVAYLGELTELEQIALVDVILPLRTGIAIPKRCVNRPTEHQAILLQRLGLGLPTSIEVADL